MCVGSEVKKNYLPFLKENEGPLFSYFLSTPLVPVPLQKITYVVPKNRMDG